MLLTQMITGSNVIQLILFLPTVVVPLSCAKIALYLCFILKELGFPSNSPTPMYEDNASTIMIVNSQVPT